MELSYLKGEQIPAFDTIMRHLINREYNSLYMILQGPGGVGKTAVIKGIMSFLKPHPGVRGSVLALTGRACSQLKKDGLPASTCHSILYEPVLDLDGNLIRFVKRTDINVIKATVGDFIIVDEATMITKEMHETLSSLDLPILYVGDIAQLPPVDRENPDFNVMEVLDCPSISLIKNHRQQEGSAIEKLCSHLRENDSIPRMKADDLRMVPKSKVKTVDFHRENRFDIILCGMNKTRKSINQLVRAARGYFDDLPEEGEQIVCTTNNVVNGTPISNGELFTVNGVIPGSGTSKFFVTSIDSGNSLTVEVPNVCWETEDVFRTFQQRPVSSFTYGYCVSTHKSQGSTFGKVLFIDEYVGFFLDQQKFRYTAVSRTSDHLTVAI